MTQENELLTEEYLERHGACCDAIALVKRNDLLGYPINCFLAATGDYSRYLAWLKEAVMSDRLQRTGRLPPPVLKRDVRGNIILRKFPDGDVDRYEYDVNDRMVRWMFHNGYEVMYKYDAMDNQIYQKTSSGLECWMEYDDRGNMVHKKSSCGVELWFDHDDSGNVVHIKDSEGREEWYRFVKTPDKFEVWHNDLLTCVVHLSTPVMIEGGQQ